MTTESLMPQNIPPDLHDELAQALTDMLTARTARQDANQRFANARARFERLQDRAIAREVRP